MNLLRRAGYRSIRQGFRELAYDIQGMLALGDVAVPAGGTRKNFWAALTHVLNRGPLGVASPADFL
jgi:hypothetical protein